MLPGGNAGGTPLAEGRGLDQTGDQPERAPRPASSSGDAARVLRRARGLSAADAPVTADGLTALAHELANLLDGSMRWVSLASASLRRSMPASAGAGQAEDPAAAALRQIEAAAAGMERMAVLVDAALRSRHAAIGSPDLAAPGRSRAAITLAEAVDHAVDVVTPYARLNAVDLRLRIEGEAGQVAAGPLYSVILNALRNAIEACAEAGGARPGGSVEVRLASEPESGRIVLEVLDDGVGPPPAPNARAPFRHGFTTKASAPNAASPLRGLGLAIADELVAQAGGEIALASRGLPEPGRPGAVLRVEFPPPEPAGRTFGSCVGEGGGA